MQSSGGLTDAHRFQGKDAILSGPGGRHRRRGAGVAAAPASTRSSASTWAAPRPTSRTMPGEYERAFVTEVAGVRLRAPMMRIHTVAAGGGSICAFDGARFRVGPGVGGRQSGPGVVSARRSADRDRLQRDGRQDRSRRCSRSVFGAARRPAARRRGRARSVRRAGGDARDAPGIHARSPEAIADGFLRHRRRQHGARDQAHLGRARATTSPNTRCAASAAPAASTPARSPTRWA